MAGTSGGQAVAALIREVKGQLTGPVDIKAKVQLKGSFSMMFRKDCSSSSPRVGRRPWRVSQSQSEASRADPVPGAISPRGRNAQPLAKNFRGRGIVAAPGGRENKEYSAEINQYCAHKIAV